MWGVELGQKKETGETGLFFFLNGAVQYFFQLFKVKCDYLINNIYCFRMSKWKDGVNILWFFVQEFRSFQSLARHFLAVFVSLVYVCFPLGSKLSLLSQQRTWLSCLVRKSSFV